MPELMAVSADVLFVSRRSVDQGVLGKRRPAQQPASVELRLTEAGLELAWRLDE